MKRNYGIDLLRVVCMYFVVVLHLVGLGGVLANTAALSSQYLFSHFLQTATYCAVNCYALISGFVAWDRKPKLRGLVTMWVKALVWCLGATLVLSWLQPEQITQEHWLKALLPVSKQQYWYLTAYVGLFFFQPILNAAIRQMSQKEMAGTLALLLCLSLAPVTRLVNLYRLGEGYSCWWLCFMYLLGGWMGKYDLAKRLPGKFWLLGYVLAVLLAWLPRMAAFALVPELADLRYGTLNLQYTSPLMILAAACLVLGFSRLKLGKGMEKTVRALAPYAFGVYLFHVQPLIFKQLITGRLSVLGGQSLWVLAGGVFAGAALIYAVGTAADWLLTKLIRIPGWVK